MDGNVQINNTCSINGKSTIVWEQPIRESESIEQRPGHVGKHSKRKRFYIELPLELEHFQVEQKAMQLRLPGRSERSSDYVYLQSPRLKSVTRTESKNLRS